MYTSNAASSGFSASAGVLSAGAATSSSSKLVQLLDGEYTASSVIKDQRDALRLGLTRLIDGNFGAAPSRAGSSAASNSSSATLSALSGLMLGGA